MLDLELLVLAKSGQALRVERAADFAGPLAAVERRDGAVRSRSRTSLTTTLASPLLSAIAMSRCCTRLAMSATIFANCAFRSARSVGEHAHRHLIFADAVDPAGEMILGAERGLEKSVDDLAVGEGLLFGALARRDRRNLGRREAGRIDGVTAPCRPKRLRKHREERSLQRPAEMRVIAQGADAIVRRPRKPGAGVAALVLDDDGGADA